MDAVLGEGRPQAQSNFRSSSASMPMMANIFRRVPSAMSRPAWIGTTTVRPSGWRITRWLPLILTTVNPAPFKRLDHLRPRNSREGAGHQATSRVSVSSYGGPTSASNASSASRRSATAASAVGPSPAAPTHGRSCAEAHQTPSSSCSTTKGTWTTRVTAPISDTDSAPVVLGSTEQSSTRSRGLVGFWAARPTGPDRLDKPGVRELVGEQGMPTPFSRQRRKTADESHTYSAALRHRVG